LALADTVAVIAGRLAASAPNEYARPREILARTRSIGVA